jgi:hypothetical protein
LKRLLNGPFMLEYMTERSNLWTKKLPHSKPKLMHYDNSYWKEWQTTSVQNVNKLTSSWGSTQQKYRKNKEHATTKPSKKNSLTTWPCWGNNSSRCEQKLKQSKPNGWHTRTSGQRNAKQDYNLAIKEPLSKPILEHHPNSISDKHQYKPGMHETLPSAI